MLIVFLENEYLKFNTLCEKMVGKPFVELASNHPKKIGLPDISSEVGKPYMILNVSVFLNVVIALKGHAGIT